VLRNPPITRDQVALMRRDNVADTALPGFAQLGIEARSLEQLLPGCLLEDPRF
jgi:NADH dehydrogenase